MSTGFANANVVLFESRLADSMARAVQERGGSPISAPSMREVPLDENPQLARFAQRLLGPGIDVTIFLTGVGTRLLLETLIRRHDERAVLERLRRSTVVARGPKPVRALAEYGIPVTIPVPEPNTWHEIVQALDGHDRSTALGGRAVAIQEYGVANGRLIEALRARGADVLAVPVYRWSLPLDRAPLERAIRRIIDGDVQLALLTNAHQIHHVVQCAAEMCCDAALRRALREVVIASVGPSTTEAVTECGLRVDYEASRPTMGVLVDEVGSRAAALLAAKRHAPTAGLAVGSPPAAPAAAIPRDLVRSGARDSLLMQACRREPTAMTPVWLMRQAGRYMAEYRAIRQRVPFLELCKTPELVAEVTVTAAARIKADAAILFSDILVIVEPMGLGLEFTTGDGPVITDRVGTASDIDRMREVEPAESLGFVFEAVRQTRAALRHDVPLIGFAGAPFTLASYMIEGGASKTFLDTKRFMYADPGAWHALMQKLTRGLIKLLNGQIEAGADAVQLFDSWVGCLGPRDYETFVLPHTRVLIQGVRPGVPVIHFGTGTSSLLPLLRRAGGDVIGADFRVELDDAWQAIGHDAGIQGNLDPAVLCAPLPVIRERVERILAQAAGRTGHIFNLGHGVLPQTPVEHVVALVDLVHALSRR